MNCKPGDLAIVVRDRNPTGMDTTGLIVTCLMHVPSGHEYEGESFGMHRGWRARGHDVWLVSHDRYGKWLHADRSLRPIRPGDLEDETPTVRELEAA